jgi:hypothetical protein
MSAGHAASVAHKRRLNVAIRADVLHAADRVGFVCECGMPGCLSVVWLRAGAYDSEREDPLWSVLARGHKPATVREAA